MRPSSNKDIAFFVDQSAGQKLNYREELFHRVEKFNIQTNEINSTDGIDVTFKVVSEFKENNEILIQIYYTLSNQIKVLFFITILSLVILTYKNFSTTQLFAVFLTLFCQVYDLYSISLYVSALYYYLLNTHRLDIRKIVIFSLFYLFGSFYSLNGIISFIFLNVTVVKDNQSQSLTLPYLFDILRLLFPVESCYSLLVFKLMLIAIFVYTNVVSKPPVQRAKSYSSLIFIIYLGYLLILLCRSLASNDIIAYTSMEPFIMKSPFIPYHSTWIQDVKKKLSQPFNISNCDFCNFTSAVGKYKPNSNYNDSVIVTGFGKRDIEIEYFVRTFRSTGTKARIVLFTNPEDHSERLAKILRDCNVVIIDVPDFKNFHFLLKRKTRFPLMFDLLSEAPEYFNRVMYCDLFDTMFQGDPFTEETTTKSVVIASEPETLFNRWAYVRARKIAGWHWYKYKDSSNLCSGFFVGSAAMIKTICELEIAVYGPNFKVRSSDQIILNYLVHTNQFQYLGIDFDVSIGANSHYPSIAMDKNGYNLTVLGEIKHYKTGVTPLLIHQYNRNWEYSRLIHKYCPGSGYEFNWKL